MTRADGSWWAPEDCRAPVHPSFASAAQSGEHGRKLYTLFVKDITSYGALTGKKLAPPRFQRALGPLDAMTQIIVKEAWKPVLTEKRAEECKDDHAKPRLTSYLAPVTMDGKSYSPCESAGLFIMFRPAKVADDTDEGWVYGTVTFDRREHTPRVGQSWFTPRVTSAGRVESCMRCHTKAPHGRLFGMQEAK